MGKLTPILSDSAVMLSADRLQTFIWLAKNDQFADSSIWRILVP